ncbi:MAG: heme exporter protein CcmD [Rhodospirillales bacterium]|nr:heme exporter protein CcmD [Rhodospirillales bacterium]
MDGLETYFEMGGYGGYVWPAFGITILVLAALLIASLRSLRARKAALDALERQAAESGAPVTRRRRIAREA